MPMLGYKRGALCTTDIDKDHGKVPLSGALRVQTSLTHEAYTAGLCNKLSFKNGRPCRDQVSH